MSECSIDGGDEFVVKNKCDSVIYKCLGLGCGYMMDWYKLECLYFYNNYKNHGLGTHESRFTHVHQSFFFRKSS